MSGSRITIGILFALLATAALPACSTDASTPEPTYTIRRNCAQAEPGRGFSREVGIGVGGQSQRVRFRGQ